MPAYVLPSVRRNFRAPCRRPVCVVFASDPQGMVLWALKRRSASTPLDGGKFVRRTKMLNFTAEFLQKWVKNDFWRLCCTLHTFLHWFLVKFCIEIHFSYLAFDKMITLKRGWSICSVHKMIIFFFSSSYPS